MTARPLRVLFLSRSLEVGGAERQLVMLAQGLAARGHQVMVATFYPGGALAAGLAEAGVTIRCLDKSGRWDVFGFLGRLVATARSWRPDVLYTFLPVPNLIGAVLRLARVVPRLVWGVRSADVDLSIYDSVSRATYAIQNWFAQVPDRVCFNSGAGRDFALANGFPPTGLEIVPNGIDTDRFHPDPEAGLRQRAAWGVAPGRPLVGQVARLDPIKDHPTFLAAVARVAARHPDLAAVCVGDGSPEVTRALAAKAAELGLGGRVIWAGACSDMTAVYNALDVATLTSTSEGFPNVLGEAMACGVPCATTECGDARLIVGDAGFVVPIGDADGLAEAMTALLAEGPTAPRRAQARQRIVENFSLAAAVNRTERMLSDVRGACDDKGMQPCAD